jgi:hypothetical protein
MRNRPDEPSTFPHKRFPPLDAVKTDGSTRPNPIRVALNLHTRKRLTPNLPGKAFSPTDALNKIKCSASYLY